MRALIAVLGIGLVAGTFVALVGAGAWVNPAGDPAQRRSVEPPPTAPELISEPPIRWRRSRALGSPAAGGLVGGVRLPPSGWHFATWDHVLRRSPNRPWRRWGTDRLIRLVLRIAREHRLANPGAPRVLIGDLSRPRGGDFGVRYGRPGHLSHQNGLDVDVYYPRRDRREREAFRVGQIDRQLAQDLVDRFVRAGVEAVFVGPNTRLAGPRRIVRPLRKHDNHMHVRIR